MRAIYMLANIIPTRHYQEAFSKNRYTKPVAQGNTMPLSEYDALRRYAAMMNSRNPCVLEPLLADDFVYESQTVFQALKSKTAYLEYMHAKFIAIAKSQSRVLAEMGVIATFGKQQACVILAQGEPDHLVGLVFANISDEKLSRLDLCIVPDPHTATRTGYYPGLQSTTTDPSVPER